MTVPCRYGTFSVFRCDTVIGRSLRTYGEWAQAEIDLLLRFVHEHSVVVDAGANLGTHTLAFAERARAGRVFAFEPQPQVFSLLEENVARNRAENVTAYRAALAETASAVFVPVLDTGREGNFGASPVSYAEGQNATGMTLDSLGLARCDLIKCDVEGMESDVLRGARKTIQRCRPVIYAEALSVEKGLELLGVLKPARYSLWVHRAAAFNPWNYLGCEERLFGLARESNVLAIPSERAADWTEALRQDPSLVEAGSAHQLAQAIVDTPRWGEPELAELNRIELIARLTRLLGETARLEERLRETVSALTSARQEQTTREIAALQNALASPGPAVPDGDGERIHALEAAVRDRERQIEELRNSKSWRWMKPARTVAGLFVRQPDLGNGIPAVEVASDAASATHPLFDASWYLENNPDVAASGVNPLHHYLSAGWREGRDPHPLFSAAYYREQAGAVEGDPALHFVETGFRQGLDPHPLFDSSFYLSKHPGLMTDGLTHFLREGSGDPHPLFDTAHYLRRHGCDGVNPLVHFALHGREQGFEPKPVFELVAHHRVLVEFDQLRADGKPVILAISHIGGGGTEKHVRDLKSYLGDRCHVFLLSPANRYLFGPALKGRVRLTPLGEASESALLFDPVEGMEELVTALRAIGVSRVHVHHILGNEEWIGPLVRGLGVPFDVTIHDYYLLSPQPQLVGPDGRYAGEPDEHAEWRARHGWLLREAERAIAPSVAAAERVRRYFPEARLIAAEHPSAEEIDAMAVTPAVPDGKLRILLIGELSMHKGREVASACARLAQEKGLPLEFHLAGFADGPAEALIEHGRYRDENLSGLIGKISPHVAWFPALWPETFAYTLSAALMARLPVVATEIGSFPERLGGRPWTWIAPAEYMAEEWCALFAVVRESLMTGRAPVTPPACPKAIGGFYDTEYVVAD